MDFFEKQIYIYNIMSEVDTDNITLEVVQEEPENIENIDIETSEVISQIAEEDPTSVAEVFVVAEEPEPVVVEDPEPVAEEEPEPVVVEDPEPVAEEEPEPVVTVEEDPEPVVEEEPEPVVTVVEDPEPVIVTEESTPEPEITLYDTPSPQTSYPSIVFVIPYRDREQHLAFFKNHMLTNILNNTPKESYQLLIVHQNDSRSFNRGAMKNIGFLHIKQKYPNDYDKITLVFNDVDTMPYTNILNYETTRGIVKHFYGYTFALGGIFSINAKDFEETGGFPNFWAWGYEDNAMNQRVLDKNLTIDRSTFFPIMDKNILQLKDGVTRLVNRSEYDSFKQNHMDRLTDIYNIQMSEGEDGFLNVNAFDTVVVKKTPDTVYDMTKSRFPFKSNHRRGRMGMFF